MRYSILVFLASTFLYGCVSIQPGDTDLDNPFEKEYKIKIEDAKGLKGHDDIQTLQSELEKSGKDNKKTIKLSYSVKNKLSEMDSTYGKIVLPFEVLTLGIIDVLGVPSDFTAQTVYMNATVQNEQGRTIGRYSSDGSAWHTVALYYGYSSKDAQRMADIRSFNKALNNLYQNIENNQESVEKSSGLSLINRDFDNLVNHLVNDIIESGSLNKKDGKYILTISDIIQDTKHNVDTEIFVKKLRIALQKENKVIMSTVSEDKMVMKSRELRKSRETNQTNVAQKNALTAPEISLTGRIVEKEISSDTSEYTIMLTINNLKKGISLWEGEQSIVKTGKEN
ncbi:MAG: hypothetical protein ACI4OR_03150 [Alphaproteobacteria bacterium]